MTRINPEHRTGTAQDLLRVVTRAYELEIESGGARPSERRPAGLSWIAPLFRALGIGFAFCMEFVPPAWTLSFHARVCARLAGRTYPFDPSAAVLARARVLAARLEEETGSPAALLAFMSHPPSVGELSHLNFELARHAFCALREARGRPCRPRQVVATDPFALDAASVAEEGFYAGYMGTYHLGVDRMALGRRGGWSFLTPRASWVSMPQRLLAALGAGGEIGLVLAGGVPATGRVLYGVREWARRARASSPRRGAPDEVSAALRGDASYARFERAMSETLRLPRSPWRLMEAWLMAAAAGLLPGETLKDAAAACLACLAVSEPERSALLAEVLREAARRTPSRRRLFSVIAGRVARRRPVVFIPVVHRESPPGVEIREACSWERGARQASGWRVGVRRADAPGVVVEMDSGDFAERFVEENFA